MSNPRWPHTFVIIGEALDENGLPMTDDEGNPITEYESVEVVRYDGAQNPRMDSSGRFDCDLVEEVPWGYRTATGGIKESGDVIVADYKISCPMILTDIPTGTQLVMKDYTRSFRVKVVKQTTYNWGTNLWVDNVKN